MATKQGSVDLIRDPVAQQLLQSRLPAHLAYSWIDGTPRVVPIWFHWNDVEIVLCTPTDAPKMGALQDGDRVAVSIDTDAMPHKVLLVRVRFEPRPWTVLRRSMRRQVCGCWERREVRRGWIKQRRSYPRMSRIFVTPDWVGVLDFEGRFPSAIERAMGQK